MSDSEGIISRETSREVIMECVRDIVEAVREECKAQPPAESELAAIAERASKATPGPWCVTDGGRPDHTISQDHGDGTVRILFERVQTVGHENDGTADAEFCAHAREDIPRLLTAINERDFIIDDLRKDAGMLAQDALPADAARAEVARLRGLAKKISDNDAAFYGVPYDLQEAYESCVDIARKMLREDGKR